MSADTDIIVLELVAAEPEEALPRFVEVAEAVDVTTVRRWNPYTASYAVIHDPGLRIIEAVEDVPELHVPQAARLEFPTLEYVHLERIEELLPTRLEQRITFPAGAALPAASIPPPGKLVFCPFCDERFHDPPACGG